jgi:hypothetical protein
VPYRCLYSRNVENLFLSGRSISTTHVALGTTRVMRTGGMLGEVVGMAASICKKHNCLPRAVYTSHLGELKALMEKGIGDGKTHPPQNYNLGGTLAGSTPRASMNAAALTPTPENLAGKAKATANGTAEPKLNDGKIDLRDNATRWLSTQQERHEILLEWPAPVKVSNARLVSGYTAEGKTVDAMEAFTVEGRAGGTWRKLADVKDNREADKKMTFPQTETDALRIVITGAKGGIARIWEVEAW